MPFPGFRLPLALAALLAALLLRGVQARDLDVPFFPTPQPAVEKMLEMADIKSGDFLIDLGSGDGRIPITAAKVYGISGLGVDLDPARVMEANEGAKREQVSDKVTFKEQDLFETDLSEATVITLFLLGSVNMKLEPRLKALKPGTRILSYGWNMGEWEPDRTEEVDGRSIHLWIVREGLARDPKSKN
jgi:tRNA G37 N-methylase Trm5